MKNILIKVSGDLVNDQRFFDLAVAKASENYVIVICGGGTEISSALEKAGYEIKFDHLGRRVTKSWEERKIMRDVLEAQEKKLQDKFVGKGVVIISPILYAGPVLCPINGDDLVKAWDLGFDEIYVFTTKQRAKKKKSTFKEWTKVEIIGV